MRKELRKLYQNVAPLYYYAFGYAYSIEIFDILYKPENHIVFRTTVSGVEKYHCCQLYFASRKQDYYFNWEGKRYYLCEFIRNY